MLDLLILAASPFGTWRSTQIGPEATWWEQTISHPTIIAAFLGFFGGVLIKFLLEVWLDWIRARRARRMLAIELHAELYALWRTTKAAALDMADTVKFIDQGIYEWREAVRGLIPPPKMVVLNTQIGRLGMLPREICETLIRANGMHTILRSEINRLASTPLKAPTELDDADLRMLAYRADLLLELFETVNEPLANLADSTPYDWAKIESEIIILRGGADEDPGTNAEGSAEQ